MVILDLEHTAWDFRATRPEVALVPLACLEPHGAHLPVGTDALIMSAIARRVADRLSRPAFLLPVWPLGTSGEHLGQPGCVSLEYDTLWAVVGDLVRSLHAHGIRDVVVLNNLGSPMGNTVLPFGNAIVKTAVRQLNYETPGLQAIWVQPFAASRSALLEVFAAAGSGLDARDVKASILRHLAPNLVSGGVGDDEKGRLAMEAAVAATADYVERTLAALGEI
jgi:creatinine amidohydrolase